MSNDKIIDGGVNGVPGPVGGGAPQVGMVTRPVTGSGLDLPAALAVELNRDPTSTCGCALHFVARWAAL